MIRTISFIVLFTGVIAISLTRNAAWRDNVTLYSDVVQKSPDKARAHNNLGNGYVENNDTARAFEEYYAALRLDPTYVRAHYHLALACISRGALDMARYELERTLELDPDFDKAKVFLRFVSRQEKK